jgi:hypothetical protein
MAQEVIASKHPIPMTMRDTSICAEAKARCPVDEKALIPLSATRRALCEICESPKMSKFVSECTREALGAVKHLNKQDVFVTLLEFCPDGRGPRFGDYQGDESQIATSVVGPFYAVHLCHKLRKTGLTDDLDCDVMKMLKYNDVEATSRLVDYLSGTESGPELEYADFCSYASKRDATNRLFRSLGFENFNINQKVWDRTPSERDLQLLGEKLPLNYEYSNRITTNQAAALMCLLRQEMVVSRQTSRKILSHMYRPVEQVKIGPLPGIAAGLPVGSKIISVGGFTYGNYNDVAIVTLPNREHYVLAVFTKYSEEPTVFIPMLSKIVAKRMLTRTGDTERSSYLDGRPLAGY